MGDRDAILGAIQDRPSDPVRANPDFNPQTGDLREQFRTNLEKLGGRVIDQAEFESYLSRGIWADPASGHFSTVKAVWDADTGISVAYAAVAATGSLILANTPGTYRMSSLAPPTSIVLVDASAIRANLTEAFENLPSDNVVIVTGTSRTADIEGVMVRGVHGPGVLLVLVRDR
jgi:L-lactate utilization protein LutC